MGAMRRGGEKARWPESVYDYESGVITDDAVAELDLDRGLWVRCQCCDKHLRMKRNFGLHRWVRHKSTAKHLGASGQASESPASDEEASDYADFAATMVECIEKDTNHVEFYRKERAKRAKKEVQTNELIRKMALLVTEQQEDMRLLREEVDDLKELVYELQNSSEGVQRGNKKQRQIGYQKRQICYNVDVPPVQQQSQHKRDTRAEVIDMFEDEVQLMHLD